MVAIWLLWFLLIHLLPPFFLCLTLLCLQLVTRTAPIWHWNALAVSFISRFN